MKAASQHVQRISILLADDHQFVRQALARTLAEAADFKVVAEAGDGEDTLRLVERLRPDVVVLDVDMPGRDAFAVAQTIHAQNPATRVLFLSAFSHDRFIERALEVNAAGYATKDENLDAIIEAIRAVAAGRFYFSPEVWNRIVIDEHGARLQGEVHSRRMTLTPRELEVLRLVAQGLSKMEMAELLEISVHTVNRHVNGIMVKLQIHDRVELAMFAVREGLAQP